MKTMSTMNEATGVHAAPGSLLETAANGLAQSLLMLRRLWRRREAARKLRQLDDYMLKDMGLHRSEIDSALRHAERMAPRRR